MSQYWTELVKRLDPYTPGEQPQDQQYIKLNTNENPYPPAASVLQAIDDFDKQRLRLYPDPESARLRNALAKYHSVESHNVFLGNGSDEVLAHSFQAFFKRDKPLLFPDISYSFYPVYCGLYQIDYQPIPLAQDFIINIDDYAVDHGGIIFPNPNAPTGLLMALDQVEQLCRNSDSVVIVDEAYIDFGGKSAVALTRQFDNLLVIRTFSKSRSLAGIRLGYAIGQRDLIEALNRVKNSFNSYPVDALAQAAALASVADDEVFTAGCEQIIRTRESMTHQLSAMGFRVLPSAANFVFAEHRKQPARKIYQALKKNGVLVRYFDQPRIDNFLRITVGTDDDVAQLVEQLKVIL